MSGRCRSIPNQFASITRLLIANSSKSVKNALSFILICVSSLFSLPSICCSRFDRLLFRPFPIDHRCLCGRQQPLSTSQTLLSLSHKRFRCTTLSALLLTSGSIAPPPPPHRLVRDLPHFACRQSISHSVSLSLSLSLSLLLFHTESYHSNKSTAESLFVCRLSIASMTDHVLLPILTLSHSSPKPLLLNQTVFSLDLLSSS
jgi:hypothetical protein